MKKINIELIGSYGRLLEREPIFVSDDICKLNFCTGYQLANIIVEFKNGDKTITKHFSNLYELPIPQEVWHAGKLEVTVTVLSCGIAIKTFNIEPILLNEVNAGFEAYSELEAMKNLIAAQTEEISELRAEVKVLQENILDLQGNVCRLWEIAES